MSPNEICELIDYHVVAGALTDDDALNGLDHIYNHVSAAITRIHIGETNWDIIGEIIDLASRSQG